MPRDPKDISTTSPERVQRQIAEAQDLKEPAYKRSGSGATGAEGKEGKAGATWYSGTTVPSTGLGAVGDFYFRTTTSDVYKKTGEAIWSFQVNIKGESGTTGTTGATGEPGLSGTGAPLAVRLATAAALPAYARTTNKLEATAVGALATIDGTAAAVNDLILLKNGAAGADNGVYKVTKLGSGAEKWVMERYESMDTSAKVIPAQLITVSAGTKNHDEVYQLTTDAPIMLNTTALTFGRTAPRDFGLVEALPTSEAIAGDRCTYKADKTNGVFWDLIYTNENPELPWNKIGGPPLRNETGNPATASTVFQSVGAPSIAAPLAGEYYQFMEANPSNGVAEINVVRLGTFIGGVEGGSIALTLSANFVGFMLWRKTVTAAKGAAIQVRFKSESGKSATFFGISTEIDPVRVG